MQKLLVSKELTELSRVIFGNLPATSVLRSGLKPYNGKPNGTQIELANPRSLKEILRAPLQYPVDDLILNGFKPYEWLRYTELYVDPFLKKRDGLLQENEVFSYRFLKPRRIVNGHVVSNYRLESDVYWERKARRRRFQGKGASKKEK